MSRIFGPVTQNGYVVRDLDKAMAYWTGTLGVGPFYVLPESGFGQFVYKGAQSDPHIKLALANSGGLQIELIEQTNDAPSFYLDFLADHGPGLQHLSVWSEDYDGDIARYDALGLEPIVHGAMISGLRFCFYDAAPHTGAMMEVFELSSNAKALFAAIRAAAAHWDGSNPVRPIADLYPQS